RCGPDRGGDSPVATEFTRNLRPLLNAYGNDPRFTLVLFTLDESTYSRELAPLAGHYPAVRLGPPWWFHDSLEGMRRFRERTTETASIYKTAGFNDDTRAFCSIPARHDLARRVDANFLPGLVAPPVLPGSWLLAGERRGTDAIVVAPVKRGQFRVVVTTAGELRARQFVQVTVPPGGQQAGVYQMKISSIVPEGTVVKQGDVVAEL